MDPLPHEVAKRGINHALPLDAILAPKRRAFNAQGEVTLAGEIVAAMASVLLAVVDQLDADWTERRVEPAKHFSRDRTGFLGVH